MATEPSIQKVTVDTVSLDGAKTAVSVTNWKAYNLTGSVYDSLSKSLSFQVNRYAGAGWLLVHDSKQVISIFNTDGGITTSIWQIVLCNDLQDCFDKATALGLKFTESDWINADMQEMRK